MLLRLRIARSQAASSIHRSYINVEKFPILTFHFGFHDRTVCNGLFRCAECHKCLLRDPHRNGCNRMPWAVLSVYSLYASERNDNSIELIIIIIIICTGEGLRFITWNKKPCNWLLTHSLCPTATPSIDVDISTVYRFFTMFGRSFPCAYTIHFYQLILRLSVVRRVRKYESDAFGSRVNRGIKCGIDARGYEFYLVLRKSYVYVLHKSHVILRKSYVGAMHCCETARHVSNQIFNRQSMEAKRTRRHQVSQMGNTDWMQDNAAGRISESIYAKYRSRFHVTEQMARIHRFNNGRFLKTCVSLRNRSSV